LENAQKENYSALFSEATAEGERRVGCLGEHKKREIPECKSEFFTASSGGEVVVGRALLYWFCSKADPFQSIFSAGVLFTELLLPLSRWLWVLNPSPSSG